MDAQLVMRAQQGDEAAFAAIVEAIYGRLLHVAYRILRDRSLAEDAVQEAVETIWRKLPRLRDPARFDAWSYRLLVNGCLKQTRRHRWSTATVPWTEPVAADEHHVVDDRDQLERAFTRLSVEQRAVIVLHFYLGLTVDEVAQALGIPVGTAGSRLGRALAKLRLALLADTHDEKATSGETVP